MARLILKSPYIKSTGGAAGYLRYIATRERVEILPDDRPPTRKQGKLIAKLVKDFPDTKTLYEYESFQTKPTKAAASAFITLALESNWDALRQSEQYMKYIATRPRAERLGSHGLFGDNDGVSLEKAMAELEQYTGNVWTHIISLKREDAARLGFNNAAAWRNLIRAHRNEIAAAMKIPPADFRWYAAFHDEGEHPHIHMMAWSATPGQAYLSKEGIRQIKSRLTNDIFRDEMLHLYEQKSESRDELVRQARRAMLELVQEDGAEPVYRITLPELQEKVQDDSLALQKFTASVTLQTLAHSIGDDKTVASDSVKVTVNETNTADAAEDAQSMDSAESVAPVETAESTAAESAPASVPPVLMRARAALPVTTPETAAAPDETDAAETAPPERTETSDAS